jgi:hypothetical protein
MDRIASLQRDHMDGRARVEKAADLGLANLAGADYEAPLTFKFQKHWK